jgi:hypothetical protein
MGLEGKAFSMEIGNSVRTQGTSRSHGDQGMPEQRADSATMIGIGDLQASVEHADEYDDDDFDDEFDDDFEEEWDEEYEDDEFDDVDEDDEDFVGEEE